MRWFPAIHFAFAVLVLSSCSSQNETAQNGAAENDGFEVMITKLPKDANGADRALMTRWIKHNDACVGGINVLPVDPICKQRDADQDRLKARGWCWGAPASKSDADSVWHRCGVFDTDAIPGASQTSQGLKSDAWVQEHDRSKSPLLQTYENAIEPLYQKMGLAKVMLECGIRGQDWYLETSARLQKGVEQPQLEEMRTRMSANDKSSAILFGKAVIDGEVDFNLGSDKARSCREISNAPFVNNEAAFRP